MKKKDKKKLIRNTFLIFTLILLFCVCMGFMLLINHLIHVTVNNKPDVIAYKETAGYLYIIVAVFFLLLDCFIPYAIMDKKLNPGKTNPKVPKYRKPGKRNCYVPVMK